MVKSQSRINKKGQRQPALPSIPCTEMAEQNFPDNTIYELDNLDVLRGMNSETVDLIATDPPFNTKRNRAGTAGHYVDNWKWGDTGKLPDQWAWNEVHPTWLDEIKDENRALYEVIEAAGHCHGQDIAAFLCFLSVRLLEMHRILKPTGSLYLHCDHTANAYIRMALDAIFGAKNFRSEIAWKRSSAHSDTKQGRQQHGRIHDNLLFYTKSNDWNWNPIYTEYTQEYIDSFYKQIEPETGRRYRLDNLTGPGGASKGNPQYEVMGVIRYWRYRQEKMQELIDTGRIIQPTQNSVPCYKRYLDEMLGVPLQDLWTDINPPSGKERTGSPDQKPLALYERIILASSNPGDLVLDPFAGCATTIIAARNNERRWIGIDRRPDAHFHVVCRMMGLKAAQAEEIRQLPHLTDWMNARLAQHETHFRTEPPVRTDEGETAAPFLAPVFTKNEKSILSHREMKDYLVDAFGLRCWGCNFNAPDERHLQLDHVDPKADGGSNHLDNRALLCGPCNMAKGNRMTMSALRRQNTKEEHLTKPTGTPRGQDGHPINLPSARAQCREALERRRRGQPMQTSMLM